MKGVRLDPDSVDEMIAFTAWQHARRFRLHALRALVSAPLDAEILGNEKIDGSHDTHEKQLRLALDALLPELEGDDTRRLMRMKEVLELYKDTPIRLDLAQGRHGRLSVSMDSPS